MPDVDLDAARRARAEARKVQPSITLAGKKYKLVPELSLVGAFAHSKFTVNPTWDHLNEFLGYALANRADVAKVLDAGLTVDDVEAMFGAWQVTSGESSASNGSSTNGGTRSRPTSKRSTKSTSAKPSGATT